MHPELHLELDSASPVSTNWSPKLTPTLSVSKLAVAPREDVGICLDTTGGDMAYPRTPESDRNLPNLPRYTSLIWEFAMKTGDKPLYKKQQISCFPMMWTCTLEFRGLEAKGQAPNSKVAMHQASHRLYEILDLDG